MNKTGLLYDPRYLLHDTGNFHPEMAERLNAIIKGLEDGGVMGDLVRITARPAEMKWIEAVHDVDYIRRFEEACLGGRTMLDFPDNQMCQDTFEIAMLAVGGVLNTVDRVMSGDLDNAFCLVRPPGHHAEVATAMGFCYFNNIAIAARYLQQHWDIGKVGIIDYDVHHGNGTQHIFEEDPTVFYYSVHEHPSFAFPGTGRSFEKGKGAGTGTTCNHPVLPGQGDSEYEELVDHEMIPVMADFKPEILLVSTGFDAHIDDDMSGVSLTTDGYTRVIERIFDLAADCAGGRLISLLEGGYNLDRLGELALNHVNVLLHR